MTTGLPLLARVKNHPRLSKYYSWCGQFIAYLLHKEDLQIVVRGVAPRWKRGWHKRSRRMFMERVVFFKPYMHRWKSPYMKMRIAKLYLLDQWATANPLPLTLLTFTTYQDSAYAKRMIGKRNSIEDSWKILNTGFRKASLIIRNKIRPGVSYFWVVEPHPKSGYPHIHAGFFTEFTDTEIERLKNHWSKVIKAGDKKHGLDISLKIRHARGEILSLRDYLMKYLAKTFHSTIPDWSPEELVFNAIAWKKGYRFFGCSRNLSRAMKGIVKEHPNFIWRSTSLRYSDLGPEGDVIIRENPKFKS